MGVTERAMRQKKALRIALYLMGLAILAAGITLNTKTTLGVSPIVSVAYCVSEITGWNFGNTTFLWYTIFVLVEIALHLIRKTPDWKRTVAADLLQIVVSLIFTRFMNLFSAAIPVFETAYPDSFAGSFWGRFLFLLLAVALTGVGAALSLFMRIVPNPGDGLVQAISDFTGVRTGTAKNCVDIGCVVLTAALSLLLLRRVVGVGVGTLIAMLGVGRVVAVFERLCGARLKKLVEETGARGASIKSADATLGR